MAKMTERQKQAAAAAAARLGRPGKTYVFDCDDGEGFSCVAPTESGAWRVLNAERPGMRAELEGHFTIDP